MSKNRSRFNNKNKGKSVPKQDSVLSGSQPPPPPTRSRSFEELRQQVQDLKTQNEKLKNQMDQKPQPTASEIAQRNPNRANPNPDQAPIKLDQYATDWLEEEHANVIVDLSDDFEDYPIEQHANVIESENSVLLGMPQEDVNRLVNGFKAFSVLNICYRLLLTLPGTARIEAQQLISTLKADDVPENTPLLVEMSSHLGKTKTENYGNIRINHQLHVAKKRILKAMSYVWNVKTFRHELTCRPNRRLNELFSDDVWKKGVFLDRDSLTWLKHDAKIYLDLTAEKDYKFKINGESYLFGIPSFQEPKWTKNGKYRPDASFVKKYIKRIGWLADEKERNHIAAAMIIQTLDYSFVKARTMSLAEYDTTWRDTIYANANFENICEFLGSIILDDIVNDKDLAENYGVISTTYRTLLESKVKMTFKTVPLKKDEFGTEALLLENPEWTKGDIPYVKSSFKVHNTNNIVASGIFGFSKGVKFTISDKMYLKSPVRNIISDMLNKYCRKK